MLRVDRLKLTKMLQKSLKKRITTNNSKTTMLLWQLNPMMTPSKPFKAWAWSERSCRRCKSLWKYMSDLASRLSTYMPIECSSSCCSKLATSTPLLVNLPNSLATHSRIQQCLALMESESFSPSCGTVKVPMIMHARKAWSSDVGTDWSAVVWTKSASSNSAWCLLSKSFMPLRLQPHLQQRIRLT